MIDLEDVFKSIEQPKGKKNEYLYTGRVLYVDLTKKEILSKAIDQNLREKFIGGWGLAVKLLYDLIDPGVEPLSRENAFVIMTGPVCGTLVPASSRTCLKGINVFIRHCAPLVPGNRLRTLPLDTI